MVGEGEEDDRDPPLEGVLNRFNVLIPLLILNAHRLRHT